MELNSSSFFNFKELQPYLSQFYLQVFTVLVNRYKYGMEWKLVIKI